MKRKFSGTVINVGGVPCTSEDEAKHIQERADALVLKKRIERLRSENKFSVVLTKELVRGLEFKDGEGQLHYVGLTVGGDGRGLNDHVHGNRTTLTKFMTKRKLDSLQLELDNRAVLGQEWSKDLVFTIMGVPVSPTVAMSIAGGSSDEGLSDVVSKIDWSHQYPRILRGYTTTKETSSLSDKELCDVLNE